MGKDPGNATQAAFDSYNVKNRSSAEVLGSVNLKNPRVQREIETLMEDHNITDDLMMSKLKEGLDATVVANYKGEAVETEIPDQVIRHKYWQDAAKIKELYPAEKFETRSLNIDVQLESMSPKEIAQMLKGLLKEYEQKISKVSSGIDSNDNKKLGVTAD